MNDLDERGRRETPQEQTRTVLAQPAFPQPTQRPCMALARAGGTTGAETRTGLNCLLRRRLRIACTITLFGSTAFLIKSFFYQIENFGPRQLDQAMHALLVAVELMCCVLMWTQLALSTRVLRFIELTLFGSLAAYFAFIQFRSYAGGALLVGVDSDHREGVLALANSANAFRWFVLIVLYGTFIPNTWKRCARVVGLLVVLPLLLNLVVCYPCRVMGIYTWPVMFDMTVVLTLGAAIALFGSYKINELEQEASEARKLGQYKLLRRLGSGGMGEVFLGEHMLLRRACAIKVIRPDQTADATTFWRFEREVQAMATLTHWNTVEVYDYGHADDGTFYYVMEYLPGLSLHDLVERHGPLSAGRAIYFLRQVCAALREAHGIGLIHRDIKPSNVIACQRGGVHDVAKLLDFGLVHDVGFDNRAQQLTIQGTILGSPPFISPEQARGRGVIDARTDIYSLGALAYYLVTGQPPFVREAVMELIVAHLHDTPASPRQLRPELPADLEDVILTCLQKDPEQRYADVQSLDEALAACEAARDWDAEQAELWWANLRSLDAIDPTTAVPTLPAQPA
jgi:tRNA A-37 threonylcarbamoyl transferase component Bud32